MKNLLTVTALVEGGLGLALIIMPSFVASLLLGTSLKDPGAILIGRLAGVTLISIAVACWLSRDHTHSFIMVKVMFLYNVFSLALLFYAVLGERISGPGLWPAILLHVGLLIWCLSLSVKSMRKV